MGERKLKEEEKIKADYTIDEYLVLEEKAKYKNEYSNGKIIAMSGGTLNHGILIGSITHALINVIRKKGLGCITFSSENRIYIDKRNNYVYPDASVVCGDVETSEKDKNSIVNPVLVVEVLSDSTEAYDRGEKFKKYCSLPSFKEYVLIDQHKPSVDIIYRGDEALWKMSFTVGLEKSIYLHTLDCHILMTDIYTGVQQLKNTDL